MKFLIFVIFAYLNIVNSQHIFEHPCKERPILQNFDIQKYVAHTWYELMRFDATFEKHCDCGQATYTLNSDNSVEVKNCCKRFGEGHCSLGKAALGEPDQVPLEGKFIVSFGQPATEPNYKVLSTDYENYSIVYNCKNLPENKSLEFFWLLSSKPQLDDSVKSTVDNLIKEYFETDKLYTVNQTEEFCAPRDY
ncbi:hypothetical protein PVAND_011253 [Polypedilum vanderplanki]|uniref:Lipocalin/cytosolic fatty-acid binding domain-containing protein n=1 Tax=Polypedilum vanderplanki TaxID=319348 RepID=A0A9J6CIQ6_POLVA|nr:hypothetical protein PVAND_011253 [Polypedilum vanderplanki]